MESTTDYEHYFATLNELRNQGKVNMMSAPGLLRKMYGLERREAYDIFKAWTKSLRQNNNINYPIANQFDDGEEDLNGNFAEPVLIKNDNET